MINLEQVRQLENKVAKAVDYVEKLTRENAALLHKEADMQAKLESNQKRIDELEVLIMGFKEEQGQIEDTILAALDRLSRFEEAMEKSLRGKPPAAGKNAAKDNVKPAAKPVPEISDSAIVETVPDSGDICFEIPETGDDINDPLGGDFSGDDDILEEELDEDTFADTDRPPEDDGELDIF